MVVTNVPEATAGSARTRSSTIGIKMPPSAPATRLQMIASPITTPSPGILNQATAAIPVMTAKAMPLTRPTSASRSTTRNALLAPSSRVASARTATVMVWVAALPPWLATIGASTASATIFSSWPSNRPSTEDARQAVARLTSSKLKRARAMVQTLSDNCSSLVTPPSAFKSSSASSSITSTTSSMVITPTSRFSVSTTGAATRLYLPNIRATSSWSSSTETRRRSSSTSSDSTTGRRDRLRLELFEDLFADGIVNLVQRREVEVRPRHLNQADAIVGFERCDQIAEIGLVKLGHHRAQERRIIGLDTARDLFDELGANFAIFGAHRQTVEHGSSGVAGNVHIFDHDAPRRFDRMVQLV